MINAGRTIYKAYRKFKISGVFGFVFSVYLFGIDHYLQAQNQIIVSEFMAQNVSALQDEDGDYSDWIELLNLTDNELDLDGYYLSDDPDNLIKWLFPPVTITSQGYLVVFASGKDQRTGELHTNFKLSALGGNIIITQPDGVTVEFSLTETYPPQFADASFSIINDSWFYTEPTPGLQNQIGNFINPPRFSVVHGFFKNSFQLEIFPINGEKIIFTKDGSHPTPENGILYENPILIDTTTIVRAVAMVNSSTSQVVTSSYIFPGMVKDQPDNPVGYPTNWGSFSQIEGFAPADYEMDSSICNHESYRDLVVPALTSIPTISISTNKDNLFSHSSDPEKGGIYIHTNAPTGGLGEDWERAVSAEYINSDGSPGFQINCGIRINGGHSRVPEKNPKHSFRLIFRKEYGQEKLQYDLFDDSAISVFKSIILRAGFNQTWLHWDNSQRKRAQYIHDSWAKDTWQKLGHKAANNNFVHLYLNGLYWGLYNISERMDDDFMSEYLGGNKGEWDVIKDYAEVAEGNKDAWNAMMAMAKQGLSDASSYYKIQGKNKFGEDDNNLQAYLDVPNLIDYMILNFYAGNLDWDHHNWVAARNRVNPGKGFQFFPWDSERIFNGLNNNIVDENNEDKPSFLYSQLRKNPAFRIEFTRRANELLGSGGLLSPDSVKATWIKRSEEIELAIIAESARWGDYRRDKHQHQSGPYELYTRNSHWLPEQDRLMNEYFPERSQIVWEQLQEIGLGGDMVTSFEPDTELKIPNQIIPNPFSQDVTFRYMVAKPGIIEIFIYSPEGKVVQNLYKGYQPVGIHQISWNPGTADIGLYFYKIKTPDATFSGKMIYVP